MNTATRLHRDGQKHIVDLAHVMHNLWVKVCKDVGIPEDSKFVIEDVLTESKYYTFYANAQRQYWEAISQYQAGGYVGLRIGKR